MNEEIAVADLVSPDGCVENLFARIDIFEIIKSAGSIIVMDIRICVKDSQIRDPAVSGKRSITYRYVEPVFVKEYRHYLKGFVMFIYKEFSIPAVYSLWCIFISAVQCRRAEQCIWTISYCVRIVCKSVKLLLKLRFFIEDIREERSG